MFVVFFGFAFSIQAIVLRLPSVSAGVRLGIVLSFVILLFGYVVWWEARVRRLTAGLEGVPRGSHATEAQNSRPDWRAKAAGAIGVILLVTLFATLDWIARPLLVLLTSLTIAAFLYYLWVRSRQ